MFRGGELMQADKPISGFRPQLVISKALIVKELPDSRCCVFAATTAQQSTESQIVSHHQENRFYRIASGEERLDNDERELGSDGILGRWWGGDLAGGGGDWWKGRRGAAGRQRAAGGERGSYYADYQGVAHSPCSPFAAGGARKVLRVKELATTVHRDRKAVD